MMVSKELQEKLSGFLAEFDDLPITWGQDDCTMFGRKWIKAAKNIDVPFHPVSNKKEAYEFIRAKGGLENIWRDALGSVGFHTGYGQIPSFGDVGLIETKLYGDIGAIFAHGGFAAVRELSGGWRWFSPRSVKIFWELQC